jgi:hypothetical protein
LTGGSASAAVTCWLCRERPPAAGAIGAAASLCADCELEFGQPGARAWQTLAEYLLAHWDTIRKLGRFDLTKAFPGDARAGALAVHLHFLTVLACRLRSSAVPLDLESFAHSLRTRRAHPDVSLLVADARAAPQTLLLHDAEVRLLRNQDGAVQSARWTELRHPIAIKVSYLKPGAPLRPAPGEPWHPDRQRRLVRLSPYLGEASPLAGIQGLRI